MIWITILFFFQGAGKGVREDQKNGTKQIFFLQQCFLFLNCIAQDKKIYWLNYDFKKWLVFSLAYKKKDAIFLVVFFMLTYLSLTCPFSFALFFCNAWSFTCDQWTSTSLPLLLEKLLSDR
jgi:hypothetical protein